MKRLRATYLVAAVIGLLTLSGSILYVADAIHGQTVVTPPPAQTYVYTPPKPIDKGEIYTELNAERSKTGFTPLTISPALEASACAKADDMIARGYWSHNAPDGTQPWYFFTKVGYMYTDAGENLAYSTDNSTDPVLQWMNSPEHKKNILGDYSEFGLCIRDHVAYQGSTDAQVIVNHFATPQN